MYLYVSAIGLWASRIALRDPQEALCLVDLCREALKGFCLYYRLNTLASSLCESNRRQMVVGDGSTLHFSSKKSRERDSIIVQIVRTQTKRILTLFYFVRRHHKVVKEGKKL